MKNKTNAYGYAKSRKNHSNKPLVLYLEYEGEIDLTGAFNGKEIYNSYRNSLSEMHTIEQRKKAHLDNSKGAEENKYLPPLETSLEWFCENGLQFADPSAEYLFSEDKLISGIDVAILRAKLKCVLTLLSKNERAYIVLRFVDCLSQKEIAEKKGVYQQAICRYEDKLLAKMRKLMTSES